MNTTNAQSNFVTRSGAHLLLHGQTFRFAGANIYWLGLDENVGGVAYPTHFRVDDALATAEAMGATVVRAHTLGISVGCPLCLELSPGVYNDDAFQHIDYALKAAHDHNIHLIIPLVDNWRYYHGGKHTFTDWRNLLNEDDFYTNPTVIGDFEQYISHILNHVNSDTGVAYKNDPTILAWETGNEISPPTHWTQTIADFIKNIDHNHLVMDGSREINARALPLKNVDIYTTHYYPPNIQLFNDDVATVTGAQKVFIIGEYGWGDNPGGDSLSAFLSAIERSATAGDLYWSLFAHNDSYGYVQHDDGHTLHYPGDDSAMRSAAQLLRAHAYKMQGRSEPPVGVPGAPLITSIVGKQIAWRGTALGDTYSLERSSVGADGPWTLVCNRCATDNPSPWTDSTQPSGPLWYRVQAYNLAGVAGPYSSPYELSKGK